MCILPEFWWNSGVSARWGVLQNWPISLRNSVKTWPKALLYRKPTLAFKITPELHNRYPQNQPTMATLLLSSPNAYHPQETSCPPIFFRSSRQGSHPPFSCSVVLCDTTISKDWVTSLRRWRPSATFGDINGWWL